MVDVRVPAITRRYVMCEPRHFEVVYRINPWMDPAQVVSRHRAVRQWKALERVYREAGHDVMLAPPAPGLPDMVFAANAGLVIDDRVLVARFRHPEREGEEAAYRACFEQLGFREVTAASYVNEGEGDYLVVGSMILGGSGFRTDPRSHREVEEYFGRPVVPLELVDPRFYHLDTALAVLADHDIAYWPGAFSAASQATLRELFPDALIATEADAVAFGLNACSDGATVVLSAGASDLAAALADRGYATVPIDTSELQKAGGSVKCCTLELRW